MKDNFGFVIDELAAKMSRSAAASEAVRENAIVSEVDALLERLALPGEDAIVVPPMQEDHHEGDDDSDSNNNDDSERGYEQQEDMTFQQIITADPEQIEYRSYYGDPRLNTASSSPARDLRQNTFLNDLGENEMDLDVDSMRARKNQRDALLASVDPVTARKCLMVGWVRWSKIAYRS